jgi:hypothetical protein
MKKLVLALALVAGASASATPAAPFFGCKLKADIVETKSSVELLIIRGETVVGYGTSACMDIVGQTTRQNVAITIQSGGIGPAFNGPLQGLKIYAVRAGLTGVDGMEGTYQLAAGPRLGLIAARVGLMAGVQISGSGVGAGVEAVIENRFSVGLDLGGMAMTVVPTSKAIKTRY